MFRYKRTFLDVPALVLMGLSISALKHWVREQRNLRLCATNRQPRRGSSFSLRRRHGCRSRESQCESGGASGNPSLHLEQQSKALTAAAPRTWDLAGVRPGITSILA